MTLPQVGVGGGGPTPMKLSTASARTDTAKMNVSWTISGAMLFARMWRKRIRR